MESSAFAPLGEDEEDTGSFAEEEEAGSSMVDDSGALGTVSESRHYVVEEEEKEEDDSRFGPASGVLQADSATDMSAALDEEEHRRMKSKGAAGAEYE